MILDRLVLHNFKRFKNAEIDFKDGITGILGNNGSGKSSLVSAILFALYGVQATGIAADYIVSSFAGPRDRCEVRLDFRIGGDSYTVVRTFKKGKTVSHDATFHNGGKLVATGVSPVEDAVKRTLGMGPVDFRNTIYAAQKDLLTLLENTPGKRREWFQKALGIDYLKNGSDTILKEEIDQKAGELQRVTGQLDALTARLGEADLPALEASVTFHRAAIAEQEQARAAKQKERDGLAARQKELAEQKLLYTALLQKQAAVAKERDADREQAGRLEAQLALIAQEQAEYERLKPVVAGHDDLRQRLEALRQKKEKFQQLNAELGFAMKQIADLKVREEAQKQKLALLDAGTKKRAELVTAIRAGLGAGEIADNRLETAVSFRLAEISKQAGTLAARLAHSTEEREKIAADRETIRRAGADGICPLCRQKLGEHFGSIDAEFSAKIHDLEEKAAADLARQEKLAQEKAGIDALKPSLDTLRSLDADLKQKPVYDQDLANLAGQRIRKEEDEHRIRNALTVLMFNPDEFAACEKENADLQKVQLRFIELGRKIGQGIMAQQHLDAIREKIDRRTEDLETISEEIKAAAFDPEAAARAERAVAEADAALRDIGVRIAESAKELRFAEEKIAEYRKAEQQAAGLKERISALEDELDLLARTRKLIAEYVVYLMQVVRSRLEGETSRILGEITGGRYEQVLLDDNFNLLVRDIDNDYPVDRFSGGEQDDIAVALRIALSRYLAELHDVHESTVLIFDEIFGSQDEERRANLLTALRTQESRFPQILLISHIADIQGEFASTLVVESGAGEGSRVREAE
ncbi:MULTISPECIES: SMC family ATPase [unclassified Methanoregula]|uniref:AAA family ATPase n=1 Tax=unclassified Methanoregula TaxID=2649730 RepID=UPI0009CAF1BE|nr:MULTISPECIES: SMC family ATPase [unclassified Methanoregula]OPX65360.1 MAG: DNA double-strand break repair Rad50 ATPase [Methanoregula sp. PtaB.Bin085]OPY32269.1 MAG: DNA double-strand break repair Rad50 ATPase [Methanoregula sp. PtaU1.Bin006]